MLGVDHVDLTSNHVENNDFYGVSVIDWCVAVDCNASPPVIPDTVPENNNFVLNNLSSNGTNPTNDPAFQLFAAFAADITYLVPTPNTANCFARNTYATFKAVGATVQANSCP